MRLPSPPILNPARTGQGVVASVAAVIVVLLAWEHYFGVYPSLPGPLLLILLCLGTLVGGVRAGIYSLGLAVVYFACFHLDLGRFDPSHQNQQDLLWFVALSGVAVAIVGSIGSLRLRLGAAASEVVAMQVARSRRMLLEEVIAASHDAVVELTVEGIVQGWNAAAERITGYPAKEAMGRHISVLTTAETRADQAGRLAKAYQGEVCRYEATRTGKDGRKLELSVCFVPVLGDDGKVAGVTCLVQDVTAQKHSESALRHSEERFRQVAENLPGALWVMDLQWKCLYLSPGYEAVFQRSARDFLANQSSFLEFVHPEDVARVRADYTNRPRGVTFEEEFRVVRPDGTVNWIHNRAFPVHAADGSVEGMTGLATNITESKRVEEALRASESRFRSLVEQGSDPMLVHDMEGRLVDVNNATCEALSYTREELLNLTIQDIDPDFDWSQAAKLWAELPRGEVRFIKGEHRRKDGSHFPVEAHLRVASPAGAPRLLLGTVRNVTEQRRASEQLQARARQQQAVSALGLRALRQNVNAADALSVLCMNTAQVLAETLQADFSVVMEHLPAPEGFVFRGLHGWPNIVQDQEAPFSSAVDSLAGYTLLTRAPVIIADYRSETRFRVPSSILEAGAVSALGVLIYGEDETIFGTLSVHQRSRRDFTEDDVVFLQATANIVGAAAVRQRARASLLRALEEAAGARGEAERANRAKSEFLSRTSHELRTPLNAILGFGQLLQMDPGGSAENRDCTNQMVAAGQHLLSLIDDVLDIARIESGNENLHLEPVEVGGMVRDTVNLVQLQAREQEVRLQVAGGSPAGGTVQADRRRLKQVLLNLLTNGIKYNHAGGSVSVEWRGETNGTLRLRVEDTGRGLTPEEIARLCSPFERLGAEERGIEGTGLGLALSRRLIEAMGGRFGISSTPGQGSTFWIDLPSGEPSVEEKPETVTGSPEMSNVAEPAAQPARTILQIEDNFSNQQVVKILLASQRPQWHLLSAANAQTGLASARDQQPALILLDLQLPDLPGDEVLARLRQDPLTREIPVVMLSADATPHSRERLLASGALAYVTKPFNVRELLRLLDTILMKAATPEVVAGKTKCAPKETVAATGDHLRKKVGAEIGKESTWPGSRQHG